MRKLLFCMVLVCFSPALSFAESCSSMPDCESLGYELGYDSACGEDDANYVLCPYDSTYRKCIHYTCDGLGFTYDDKTEWCGRIVNCIYDEQYTLCDEPGPSACPQGTYETLEACVAVYGAGNCSPDGSCYVGDCTSSVVTCGTPANITGIAHAVLTNPCTPKYADCTTGDTVYTDWACENGYTKTTSSWPWGGWGWGGSQTPSCTQGSCEEGTYTTQQACESGCSGTCVALASSDPRYSDRCTYECVACPQGTYGTQSACEGEHGTGSCYLDGSCYVACPQGEYGTQSACEADWGSGNCSQNGSCYVKNCTSSVVTCGTAANITGIAHAVLTNPCTPKYADCTTGDTVYTDWECENGYTKTTSSWPWGGWGWGGSQTPSCTQGSCEEGTYTTQQACQSACSGTCVALASSDPRYSDRCTYECVTLNCPSGTSTQSQCNANCSGTCVDPDNDGCYTCQENTGCPEGWSDDYMICRNCPAHCLAENGCFRCNAAYCAVGTYEEVADCESACNGTCVGPNGEGCYTCQSSGGSQWCDINLCEGAVALTDIPSNARLGASCHRILDGGQEGCRGTTLYYWSCEWPTNHYNASTNSCEAPDCPNVSCDPQYYKTAAWFAQYSYSGSYVPGELCSASSSPSQEGFRWDGECPVLDMYLVTCTDPQKYYFCGASGACTCVSY